MESIHSTLVNKANSESDGMVDVLASASTRTQNTPGHIASVRVLLSSEENARCPDDMVDRYWRATSKDPRHTARRLRETLAWLSKEQPHQTLCPACLEDGPGRCSHYMHVACRDKLHRPVIYSCLQHAQNKIVQDNVKHMIMVFETAIGLMGAGVEQWCWVLDFHGFSIRDCDPRLARIFLNLAATHYPERLGHFWIIDAPALFNTLWSAVSPFIDPKTKKKIAFLSLRNRKTLVNTLSEHFNQETIDWLLMEMEDNRSVKAGMKRYDYGALGDIRDGTMEIPSYNTHCNLGSPSYLEELRGCPDDRFPWQIAAMSKGNLPPFSKDPTP